MRIQMNSIFMKIRIQKNIFKKPIFQSAEI
jgi:hypothetical protein